jgi:molybdopterin adenylyltransferase
MQEERQIRARSCLVLTISDGVAAGTRDDESGRVLADRLAALGFDVQRAGVPDEPEQIAALVRDAAGRHALVLTTGGTGLGPRDHTPQALEGVLDYLVPGLGEAMRAGGRRQTPLADLSRSLGGVLGDTLVICLPGSPRGALESLAAVEPLLDHALETVGGQTRHSSQSRG